MDFLGVLPLDNHNHGHLSVVTVYKWDYTFYEWCQFSTYKTYKRYKCITRAITACSPGTSSNGSPAPSLSWLRDCAGPTFWAKLGPSWPTWTPRSKARGPKGPKGPLKRSGRGRKAMIRGWGVGGELIWGIDDCRDFVENWFKIVVLPSCGVDQY